VDYLSWKIEIHSQKEEMICRYLNTIVHTTSVNQHVQNYLSTKQTKCTEMDNRVLNHISNTTKPSNQLPLPLQKNIIPEQHFLQFPTNLRVRSGQKLK
jgi:hypothetical protein